MSSPGEIMTTSSGVHDVGAGAQALTGSAALGYLAPSEGHMQQQYQDMLLAKLTPDFYLGMRGSSEVAASSGTNPLYEHSKMLGE